MTEPAVPAAAPATPDAGGEGQQPTGEVGTGEASGEGSFDREGALEAIRSMHESDDGEEVTFEDEEDISEAKGDGEEEEKPEESSEEPSGELTVEKRKEKLNAAIKEAFEGLTEDQVADILGANNDAFAGLTRKRRELAQREAGLESKEREYTSLQNELTEMKADWDEVFEQGKRDPVFWMELGGWTEEAITEWERTGQRPQSAELDERFEAADSRYKELQEQIAAERQARQTAEHRANEQQWHASVARAVDSVTAEAYPHLARMSANADRMGMNGKQLIFSDVVKVQRLAFEGNLVALNGQRVPAETVVDAITALRYLDNRKAQEAALLVGEEKPPTPERGGAEPTARPEDSKKQPPGNEYVDPISAEGKEPWRDEGRRLVRLLNSQG